MRIVIGISGASGAIYALEVLRRLRALGGHEIHAVVSECGWRILEHECSAGRAEIMPLVDALYANDDMGAAIAGGSFCRDAMVVAPCSMKSLAAIACGLADNLLCRAADVTIKEGRRLVLAVRETPLSAIHLENMLKLARLGVRIVPACPAFYHHPRTVDDLTGMMAGRILDSMGVIHDGIPRWQGLDQGKT
ncbi:MAG: UbiX family flavin prenyltransferase [Desulfovibrio sp.]|jgi:4-hydroxy-3-polyprenylbenzoate decarboxylase|nr:UbiX family flavin prenyltransferase [Desulfovibrio sp.]